MSDKSKIEWTEATWNPITGCSIVSPGCTNCYAMQLAGSRLQHHPSRAGLTRVSGGRPKWTGEVRFNEQWLDQPLRWKRPRMIFVCAHGDLFHENVPDEWIDRVFAVMALAGHHRFQVLTKRSGRMREYLTGNGRVNRSHQIWRAMYGHASTPSAAAVLDSWYGGPSALQWPLPNVWLGVSVEDQQRRDRIIDLAQTPAVVRWISGEPLLEGLSLTDIPVGEPDDDGVQWLFNALTGEQYFIAEDGFNYSGDGPDMQPLDWIVAGGESGPSARPMHPDWARSLRDQCAAAGVPFFFKQWGEWAQHPLGEPITIRQFHRSLAYIDIDTGQPKKNPNRHTDETMRRVGKKRAGRLLDGVEHNGMPEGSLR